MKALPLIVAGALGRMGQAISTQAAKNPSFIIKAGIARENTAGQKPEISASIFADLKKIPNPKGSVVLDFARAEALDNLLSWCESEGLPLLVGSTGHSGAQLAKINQASKKIPILVAPNTSLMANLTMQMAKLVASTVPKLCAHIFDLHHAGKKDSPSGTAVFIKKAIENNALDLVGDVNISSVRLGQITGEHKVYFAKENESLEIKHQVQDRSIFAEGALIAALFLSKQPPGLYDMTDVLNLNTTIKNSR